MADFNLQSGNSHGAPSCRINLQCGKAIEACMKNGEYAHIPYLRVWSGETCIAEFCQHCVVAVFFAKNEEELRDD